MKRQPELQVLIPKEVMLRIVSTFNDEMDQDFNQNWKEILYEQYGVRDWHLLKDEDLEAEFLDALKWKVGMNW